MKSGSAKVVQAGAITMTDAASDDARDYHECGQVPGSRDYVHETQVPESAQVPESRMYFEAGSTMDAV